jgi:hypothetical protein
VKYELGFYITEYGVLHSHRREYLTSYKPLSFAFSKHGMYEVTGGKWLSLDGI